MNQEYFQNQGPQKQSPNSQKTQIGNNYNQKHFNQLQICRPYPKSSNSIFLVFIVGLHLVYFFTAFITYKVLSRSAILYGVNVVSVIDAAESNLLPILLSVSVLGKVIIITTTALDSLFFSRRANNKILFEIIELSRQYQRLLVEIDFQTSSLLLVTQSPIAMLNFAVSIAIILFSLVFLENYCVKKDLFYIGSVKFYIFFRLTVGFGSICNYFCLILSEGGVSLYFFLIFQTILAQIITTIYLNNGHTIYKAPILKWGIFICLISFDGLVLNMWLGHFFTIGPEAFITHLLITIGIITIYFYFKLVSKKIEMAEKSNDLALQSYYLLDMMEESHYDDEVKTLMAGLIAFHAQVHCRNPECYSNNTLLYDSKAKRDCQTTNFVQNRVPLLKFYLKCKYETILESSENDFEAILLYCEFLYNQFNNTGLSLYWIKKLNKNREHLSLSAKLKLNGLIYKIKQDNRYFLSQLYGSNLQIESLIKAEEVNIQITKQTSTLLDEHIQLWNILEDQSIDLSLLRLRSQTLLKKISDTSEKWKKISNFVQQSKHWKHQYLCFAVFLKNEKLKNKILEEFNESFNSLNLAPQQKQSSQNISTIDLFDQNSCCLHAEIHDGDILIKRVSKYFYNLTGYEPSQVVMSNLNMIIPKVIAEQHHDLILEMSANGRFANEKNYAVNRVYLVSKRGDVVPALKTYKEFATSEGDLEYVCFLKRITDKQCVILCDGNFEIQGMTEECTELMSGNSAQGRFLKCFNLISLIPELAKLSNFNFNDESSDQSYSLPSLKSLSYLKKIEQQSVQSCKKIKIEPCYQKASNKTEGKYEIVYPLSDFQQYAISYQNHISEIDVTDRQKYYECIKKISKKIRHGQHQKLSCQLILNEVKNHSMHYYQVKLQKYNHNRQLLGESNILGESNSLQCELPTRAASFLEMQCHKMKGFNASTANIFIKEEANEASQSNIYLKYAKYVWTVFFLLFFVIFMARMIFVSRRLSKMGGYMENMNSTIQATITSSRLVNEYQLTLLNITDHDGEGTIEDLTSQFKEIINSPSMRLIIFDHSINSHATYPPSARNSLNRGIEYDEIDFIYFMQALIQSISQNASLNSLQVQDLHNIYMDYQFPSLNNYLNRTRDKINERFQIQKSNLSQDYVVFFSIDAILLLFSIMLIVAISYRFHQSMVHMVNIHCHFTPKDINIIKQYYRNTIQIFRNIRHDENQSIGSKQQAKRASKCSSSEPINQKQPSQNSNLNKKSKKISTGKRMRRQKVVHFLKIVLTFSSLIGITLICNSYLDSLIVPISNLQKAMLQYSQMIPTRYLSAQIVSYGYDHSSVATFNMEAYSGIVSNLKILKDKTYGGTPNLDTELYQNLKLFYLGNVCAANEQSLTAHNVSIAQCQAIAKHSFQTGVHGYSRYQFDIVDQIVNWNLVPSVQLVEQYFKSVEIYHLLNSNMIDFMINQFKMLTQSVLFLVSIFTISMCMLILAAIIFVKLFIFDFLVRQYHFYRNFYRNMMPDYIIAEEKIIRSKLTVINFL